MPGLMGREGGGGRSRRRLGWRYSAGIRILGGVAILIGLVMLVVADAAEYEVPSGDTDALIRAIDNANRNREADTIRLAPGRYEVTAIHNTTRGQNGLPVITSEITIEGQWSANTAIVRSPSIDNLVLFRVARPGHLTLKRLALQEGDVFGGSGIVNERGGTVTMEGGALVDLHNAIWNEGQATISWTLFKGNTALDDCTAINNTSSGEIRLSNGSFVGNVGGDAGLSSICNEGSLDITETTFDRNYGVSCGAIIHRRGELTLTKSSVTKSRNDGGSTNICISGGQTTIAESTIAHNQGGVGIFGDASVTIRETSITHNFDTSSGIFVTCCGSEVMVEDSTISHNHSDETGGGIFNGGSGEVVLKDTILANNDAREDGPDCFGAVRVMGSTLIGDPSGCTVRGEQQCSSRGTLPIAGVTASGFQPDREPENTLDDDLGTRWSSHGRGEWIQFDLGSRHSINEARLAWFRGDQRRARFRIQVSDNARDWRLDLSRTSSGTTLELERNTFAAQTARYVRIIGNGNTDNDWNGMTEARIVGCRN